MSELGALVADVRDELELELEDRGAELARPLERVASLLSVAGLLLAALAFVVRRLTARTDP